MCCVGADPAKLAAQAAELFCGCDESDVDPQSSSPVAICQTCTKAVDDRKDEGVV